MKALNGSKSGATRPLRPQHGAQAALDFQRPARRPSGPRDHAAELRNRFPVPSDGCGRTVYRIVTDNTGETAVLPERPHDESCDATADPWTSARRSSPAGGRCRATRAKQRQLLRDGSAALGPTGRAWAPALRRRRRSRVERRRVPGGDSRLLDADLSIAKAAKCSYGEAFAACRRADQADHSVASLSPRLDPLTVAELSEVVDDAVDRFTASAAALDAAASSAERELADRRERFKNVIDATAGPSSRPTMPAVLSRKRSLPFKIS